MRHYTILGLFCLALYFVYEFSQGNLFARSHDPVVEVVEMARGVSQGSSDFQWNGSLAAGEVIEIKGVNGGVTAHPADGSDVVVRARKTSKRFNADDVRIEVVSFDGGVTVCAVYPGNGTSCRPGREGRLTGGQNHDAVVHFDVGVPEGVQFVARTINGAVRAEGLRDRVSARTVNGSVRISTDGVADAETVNGSIQAVVGSATSLGELRFHTTNGSITLALPESIDAEVLGGTLNGRITTEFPLDIIRSRNTSQQRLSGILGAGGEKIDLRSVNGSIRVVRR